MTERVAGNGEAHRLEQIVLESFSDIRGIFDADPFWIYKERDLHWLIAAAISDRLEGSQKPWTTPGPLRVHLEYPTRSVPPWAKRDQPKRGAVDLAVLSEEDARAGLGATIRDKTRAYTPKVVIELGLDEDEEHARRDVWKLGDWARAPEGPVGFLGHFFRNPTVEKDTISKTLQRAVEGDPDIQLELIPHEPTLLLARVARVP